MNNFHVTEEIAEERANEIIAAGDALGLGSNILNLAEYEPWDRAEYARYLDDNFVQFFSVDEAIRPRDKHKAASEFLVGPRELAASS